MGSELDKIERARPVELARVLLTSDQIASRVEELAGELAEVYRGQEVTIVQVLTGALVFVADLVRRLPLAVRIESVSVSSYHGTETRAGLAQLKLPPPEDLGGRDVLVVDDIYDSGQTMSILDKALERIAPASVRRCVLLKKDRPDLPDRPDVDFVGFDIPDEFVVGYGLDFNGLYRNLPMIGVLAEHLRGS